MVVFQRGEIIHPEDEKEYLLKLNHDLMIDAMTNMAKLCPIGEDLDGHSEFLQDMMAHLQSYHDQAFLEMLQEDEP